MAKAFSSQTLVLPNAAQLPSGDPVTANIFSYNGDPNGAVDGPLGSLCLRTDGTPGVYYKIGASNTGWASLGTGSLPSLRSGFAGDGSDGTAAFDGTTVPQGANKPSSGVHAGQYEATRDLFYDSCSISSGQVLNMQGFRLYVKNTLTLNGKIVSNGADGATGANGGTHGSGAPGGVLQNGGNGGDGSTASAPATVGGSSGTAPRGFTMGMVTAGSPGNPGSFGQGGGGGNGGASSGANGGSVSLASVSNPDIHEIHVANSGHVDNAGSGFSLTPGSGGGGGGRSSSGNGGGGGGGGGYVVIGAHSVTGSGSVEAKGGNGGQGATGAGGGGGGAGGIIVIIVETGAVPTTNVSGGTGGGTGTTAGGNGGAGIVLPFQLGS